MRKTGMLTIVCALVAVLTIEGALADEGRLVQLGDKITFRKTSLGIVDNQFAISYSQDGRERSGRYVQTAAKFDTDEGTVFVPVFVQHELAQDLLSTCEDTSAVSCTVEVNVDFQYGQDSGETSRFLVYHDKSNRPYQHRFVSSSIASKFMIGAVELAEQAGSTAQNYVPQAQMASQTFNKFAELGKSYVGDYLRDF